MTHVLTHPVAKMKCCVNIFSLGCFQTCACLNTGLTLTEVGTYKVVYWYAGNETEFNLNYDSDGTTDLILPDIFNPNNIVYFKLFKPDDTVVAISQSVYNAISGKNEIVNYDCFSMQINQLNPIQFRNECNPDFPVPCGDCGAGHNFFMNPTLLNFFMTPQQISAQQTISFTLDACCQKIQIKTMLTTFAGESYENPINYTPLDSYATGFKFTIGKIIDSIPNIQAGDTVIITIQFVCTSQKGIDNADCESAPIGCLIIVNII